MSGRGSVVRPDVGNEPSSGHQNAPVNLLQKASSDWTLTGQRHRHQDRDAFHSSALRLPIFHLPKFFWKHLSPSTPPAIPHVLSALLPLNGGPDGKEESGDAMTEHVSHSIPEEREANDTSEEEESRKMVNHRFLYDVEETSSSITRPSGSRALHAARLCEEEEEEQDAIGGESGMRNMLSASPPSLSSPDFRLPTGRCCHAMNAYKDRFLIIFGGASDTCAVVQDVWVYDLQKRRWSRHVCDGKQGTHHRLEYTANGYPNSKREHIAETRRTQGWGGNTSDYHEDRLPSSFLSLSDAPSCDLFSILGKEDTDDSSLPLLQRTSSAVLGPCTTPSHEVRSSFIHSYSFSPSSGTASSDVAHSAGFSFFSSGGVMAPRNEVVHPSPRIIHSSCIYKDFLIIYGGHGLGPISNPNEEEEPPPPPPLSTSVLVSARREQEEAGRRPSALRSEYPHAEDPSRQHSGSTANSSDIDHTPPCRQEESVVASSPPPSSSRLHESSRSAQSATSSNTFDTNSGRNTHSTTTTSASASANPFPPSVTESGLLNDLFVLDLKRWVWRHLGHAPGAPQGPGAREFHTSHIYQERMYVVMGFTEEEETEREVESLPALLPHAEETHVTDDTPTPPPCREREGGGGEEENLERVSSSHTSVPLSVQYPRVVLPSVSENEEDTFEVQRHTSSRNNRKRWIDIENEEECNRNTILQREEERVIDDTPQPGSGERRTEDHTVFSQVFETRWKPSEERTPMWPKAPHTAMVDANSDDAILHREDTPAPPSRRRRRPASAPASFLAPSSSSSVDPPPVPRLPPLPPAAAASSFSPSTPLVWYLDVHAGTWHAAAPFTSTPPCAGVGSPPTPLRNRTTPFPYQRSTVDKMCPAPLQASTPSWTTASEPPARPHLATLHMDGHMVFPNGESPRTALGGHASALEGDNIYIFGGTSSRRRWEVERYSNELYIFHVPTHQWHHVRVQASKPCPPPRYGAALGVLDGVVYIFGGDRPGERLLFGDFWRIDTKAAAPEWEEIPLQSATEEKEEEQRRENPRLERDEKEEEEEVSRRQDHPPILHHRLSDADARAGADHLSWNHTSPTVPFSFPSDRPSTATSSLFFSPHENPLLVPCSVCNLERPTPRSGAAYATVRGNFYLMGGETITLPPHEVEEWMRLEVRDAALERRACTTRTTDGVVLCTSTPAPLSSSSSSLSISFSSRPYSFPTTFYHREDTEIAYSNDLYMYPLGVSLSVSSLPSSLFRSSAIPQTREHKGSTSSGIPRRIERSNTAEGYTEGPYYKGKTGTCPPGQMHKVSFASDAHRTSHETVHSIPSNAPLDHTSWAEASASLLENWNAFEVTVEKERNVVPQTLVEHAARWISGSWVEMECKRSSSTTSGNGYRSSKVDDRHDRGMRMILNEVSRVRQKESWNVLYALSSCVPSRLLLDE